MITTSEGVATNITDAPLPPLSGFPLGGSARAPSRARFREVVMSASSGGDEA